jgi:hypothetical protein
MDSGRIFRGALVTKMTREEHLQWAKERALKYCDNKQPLAAWISFRSDMSKHGETRNHIALPMGDEMFSFFLQSPESVEAIQIMNNPGPFNIRRFIEGFN